MIPFLTSLDVEMRPQTGESFDPNGRRRHRGRGELKPKRRRRRSSSRRPGCRGNHFHPGGRHQRGRDAFDAGRADPLCLRPLGIDPAESECETEKVKRRICRWDAFWLLADYVWMDTKIRGVSKICPNLHCVQIMSKRCASS